MQVHYVLRSILIKEYYKFPLQKEPDCYTRNVSYNLECRLRLRSLC